MIFHRALTLRAVTGWMGMRLPAGPIRKACVRLAFSNKARRQVVRNFHEQPKIDAGDRSRFVFQSIRSLWSPRLLSIQAHSH